MEKRFYVDEASFEESYFLSGSEFHHLSRVLRMRAGEELELINGRGLLARAQIDRLEKEGARLTILDCKEEDLPSPSLLLGISLFKLNRLEWTIEKGTELGADGFYLFPAERSEQEKLSFHQLARLRHLSIAAMKQCGRLYLPEITFCDSLSKVLDLDAQFFYGDPEAKGAASFETASSQILFLTGPEGGFSDDEIDLLKEREALSVKLHKNILRAETAPLAALYGLFCKHRNF